MEFVFAFHGGDKIEDPEKGKEHMAKWHSWVGGLGDKVSNPGTPVGKSHTVHANGVSADGGSNPISGFMVLHAENLDDAIEIAKGCPVLEINGSIEVAPVFSM